MPRYPWDICSHTCRHWPLRPCRSAKRAETRKKTPFLMPESAALVSPFDRFCVLKGGGKHDATLNTSNNYTGYCRLPLPHLPDTEKFDSVQYQYLHLYSPRHAPYSRVCSSTPSPQNKQSELPQTLYARIVCMCARMYVCLVGHCNSIPRSTATPFA